MDTVALLTSLLAQLAGQNHLAIEEAVERALAKALPDILRRAALPVFLDKKQLMELTGWSLRKVDYMRAERRIPFIRQGKKILFPTAEIEAYLREGYVPVKTEHSTAKSTTLGLGGLDSAEGK